MLNQLQEVFASLEKNQVKYRKSEGIAFTHCSKRKAGLVHEEI
jgi:hypothetical protein